MCRDRLLKIFHTRVPLDRTVTEINIHLDMEVNSRIISLFNIGVMDGKDFIVNIDYLNLVYNAVEILKLTQRQNL